MPVVEVPPDVLPASQLTDRERAERALIVEAYDRRVQREQDERGKR